jgi:cell division protein FtsN
MSGHSHESDRSAAYRGLILGAIAIAILIVSIVKLTNAKYAGEAPAKTGSTTSARSANGALDV